MRRSSAMVRQALVGFGTLGLEVARFAAIPAETLLLADDLGLDIVCGTVGGVLEPACWPGAICKRVQPLGNCAEGPARD